MFRVRWKRSALNDLASLWTEVDSAQRQAITAASHLIDQQLLTDPFCREQIPSWRQKNPLGCPFGDRFLNRSRRTNRVGLACLETAVRLHD